MERLRKTLWVTIALAALAACSGGLPPVPGGQAAAVKTPTKTPTHSGIRPNDQTGYGPGNESASPSPTPSPTPTPFTKNPGGGGHLL